MSVVQYFQFRPEKSQNLSQFSSTGPLLYLRLANFTNSMKEYCVNASTTKLQKDCIDNFERSNNNNANGCAVQLFRCNLIRLQSAIGNDCIRMSTLNYTDTEITLECIMGKHRIIAHFIQRHFNRKVLLICTNDGALYKTFLHFQSPLCALMISSTCVECGNSTPSKIY